ncbi:hypothetical protein [Streptomyces sp. NRRL S-87]|uniref:hypothetical protein n=1 Tax=Streptomyces sp. NRRL S-87 TaxID=1463920 RepID=UPI00068E3E15|nr:hypothetical protein [Streptomyces sp. NRRL S-87]
MIAALIRHAEISKDKNVLVLLSLLGSYLGMLVSAVTGHFWVFLAAIVVSYAADLHLHKYEPDLIKFLGKLKWGLSIRVLVRELAVMVMLRGLTGVGGDAFVVVFLGFVAVHSLRLMYTFLCMFIKRRRALPVRVRNLDLSKLSMPEPPPPIAFKSHERKLLYLDTAVIVGGLASQYTKVIGFGVLGVAVAVALAVTGMVMLLPTVSRCRKVPSHERTFKILNQQVAKYQPEVVLYFSYAAGARDSAYQVNMWLDTLARLGRRPLIVLREVTTLRFLAYTPLPVVCIPKADDLSLLELPDARVILYPANAGKNVHMLRIAEAKHVFIGHGDSDKLASSNRVSKVYDEIWTAGEAGDDRYQRLRGTIPSTDLVRVGRPQLSAVERVGRRPAGHVTTIMYAPTWEGWTADPYHTSLVLMGEKMIRMLLNMDRPVRIIYKPHPLTGKRSIQATRAHRRIIAMLEADNARREKAAKGMAQGEKRLAELEARMGKLKAWTVVGVYGIWDKDRAALAKPPKESWEQLQAEWHETFWKLHGPARHQVVTTQLPSLYSCFNESDMMISDISSVVSDFVQSEKPYVVCNPADMDPELFKQLNPASSAAYIMGPSCEEMQTCVEAAASGGMDRLADHRAILKRYLLGEGDSMVRFNDAVNALFAKASQKFPPGDVAEPILANPFTRGQTVMHDATMPIRVIRQHHQNSMQQYF